MRNEGDIRESVADAKMCPNEEFFGRAFGSDISCKNRALFPTVVGSDPKLFTTQPKQPSVYSAQSQ
jgi:hypothetical protein